MVGFFLSMMVAALGVLLLSIGLLIQALAPILGRLAFQVVGGSYSPYAYEPGTALWVHHGLAISCILIGALLSTRFWKAAHREEVELD